MARPRLLLLLLLLLLSGGLALPSCDRALQESYCSAWYGGDYHTGCRYCGRGPLCPSGALTGRAITSSTVREEILRRHNEYRRDVRRGKVGGMPETKVACLPPLAWDPELAEVAQVWADQCSMISYPAPGVSGFPRVFHEKSSQRSTSKFHHPPGVGQNVAWALTQDVNFTQIIDDLWYRDIRSLEPGVMDDFRVSGGAEAAAGNVITQMLWGHTTHIGCGWLQIDVGESRFDYPGRYENFFVCNYGVGGNIPGEPVYRHPDCAPKDANATAVHDEKVPTVIKPNSSSQVFPNFSVGTRTVVAACLQAIQCVKKSTGGTSAQCDELSEICHTKGPSPLAVSRPVRVLDLECRVEHILCHAMDTSPSTTCQASLATCRQAAPGSSPLADHQGVTAVMALLGLGGVGEGASPAPTPSTSTPPAISTSASLDDLTTIGSDFRLSTTVAPLTDATSDVTEPTDMPEEVTAEPSEAPTFFITETQPSTTTISLGLTTSEQFTSQSTIPFTTSENDEPTDTPVEVTATPSEAPRFFITETQPSTTTISLGLTTSEQFNSQSTIPFTTTENDESTGRYVESNANTEPIVTTTELSLETTTQEVATKGTPTSTRAGLIEEDATVTESSQDTTSSTPEVTTFDSLLSDGAGAGETGVDGRAQAQATAPSSHPSPTTESEKIGIIHESGQMDGAGGETGGPATELPPAHPDTSPFQNVEEISAILRDGTFDSFSESGLVLTPEDVAGLTEDFGDDTLLIVEDIFLDSDGRVINLTSTTNLEDGALIDSIDPAVLDALKNALAANNDHIANNDEGSVEDPEMVDNQAIRPMEAESKDGSQFANVGEEGSQEDGNKADHEGIQVANNEDEANNAADESPEIADPVGQESAGTDTGKVKIDEDTPSSQSSIRPEIDHGGAAITTNPSGRTEDRPGAPGVTGPRPDPADHPAAAPGGGLNEGPATETPNLVATFEGQEVIGSGWPGEAPGHQVGAIGGQEDDLSAPDGDSPTVVIGETGSGDPTAVADTPALTAATAGGQESDGAGAGSRGEVPEEATDQVGNADQQKNQEDAGNYPNYQVTTTALPTEFTPDVTTDRTENSNDGPEATGKDASTELSSRRPTAPPSTPLSRKVEDVVEEEPGMVPGLEEEEDEDEEQGEECFRRYTEAGRLVDISYYNTTVRTRLLTAICLEGIRCEPSQDSTRCQFLHARCNQQLDTEQLPFAMRVTLSECTVEDILCHLGHRTPVMCCQHRYSECVASLSRPEPASGPAPDGHMQADREAILHLLGIDTTHGPISLNQSGILGTLASPIFLANGSIIASDATGLDTIADNETLAIFQDFLVILDDPTKLNESLISGDNTIENIINNFKTNNTDFQIIFDPNNIKFQGPDGELLNPEEVVILDQIKTQINQAVGTFAEQCSTHVCIQSLDEHRPATNVTVLPSASGDGQDAVGGLILIETKSDLSARLELCQRATSCSGTATACLFAEERCLQLSGTDRLPSGTRGRLVSCRIPAIHCRLAANSVAAQAACKAGFRSCAASLGVTVNGGAVTNSGEQGSVGSTGVTSAVIEATTAGLGLAGSGEEEIDDAAKGSPGNLDDKINSKNDDDLENSSEGSLTTEAFNIVMKAEVVTEHTIAANTTANEENIDYTESDESDEFIAATETSKSSNNGLDPDADTTPKDESNDVTETPLGRNNLGDTLEITSAEESGNNADRPLTKEPLDITMKAEGVTGGIEVAAKPNVDSESTTTNPTSALPSTSVSSGEPEKAGAEDENEDAITAAPTGQSQEAPNAVKEDYDAFNNRADGEGPAEMTGPDIATVKDESFQTPTTASSSSLKDREVVGTTRPDSDLEIEGVTDNTPSTEEHDLAQPGKKDFMMDLPDLGISINLKPEEKPATNDPLGNDTFGMSLPTFGFNVTVDKEPTQCLVGSTVYNDFQDVPSQDPCRLCSCAAGSVRCYSRECPPPPPGCQRSRLPRQQREVCCPEYSCPGPGLPGGPEDKKRGQEDTTTVPTTNSLVDDQDYESTEYISGEQDETDASNDLDGVTDDTDDNQGSRQEENQESEQLDGEEGSEDGLQDTEGESQLDSPKENQQDNDNQDSSLRNQDDGQISSDGEDQSGNQLTSDGETVEVNLPDNEISSSEDSSLNDGADGQTGDQSDNQNSLQLDTEGVDQQATVEKSESVDQSTTEESDDDQISREEITITSDLMDQMKETILGIFQETTDMFQKINQGLAADTAVDKQETPGSIEDHLTPSPGPQETPPEPILSDPKPETPVSSQVDNPKKPASETEEEEEVTSGPVKVTTDGSISGQEAQARPAVVTPNSNDKSASTLIRKPSGGQTPNASPAADPNDITDTGGITSGAVKDSAEAVKPGNTVPDTINRVTVPVSSATDNDFNEEDGVTIKTEDDTAAPETSVPDSLLSSNANAVNIPGLAPISEVEDTDSLANQAGAAGSSLDKKDETSTMEPTTIEDNVNSFDPPNATVEDEPSLEDSTTERHVGDIEDDEAHGTKEDELGVANGTQSLSDLSDDPADTAVSFHFHPAGDKSSGDREADEALEEELAVGFTLSPVIGEKDVKVFLNFSWADGSPPDEGLDRRNLTGKIMKALNAGVGYLIIPDGEEHEDEAENTVNLVQTILLDHEGNLDINTSVPSSTLKALTTDDLKYIKKVEEKTTKIILDIFDQMETDFESELSTMDENQINTSTTEDAKIPTTSSETAENEIITTPESSGQASGTKQSTVMDETDSESELSITDENQINTSTTEDVNQNEDDVKIPTTSSATAENPMPTTTGSSDQASGTKQQTIIVGPDFEDGNENDFESELSITDENQIYTSTTEDVNQNGDDAKIPTTSSASAENQMSTTTESSDQASGTKQQTVIVGLDFEDGDEIDFESELSITDENQINTSTTEDVNQNGDDAKIPTTSSASAENEMITTTESGDQASGSKQPTIIVGLDFEGVDEDTPLKAILLDGSLAAKLEDAVGMKTVVVSKERLGTLAADDTDIILHGTVTNDGEIEFETIQNEIGNEGLENLNEIVAVVSRIVRKGINDGFQQTKTKSKPKPTKIKQSIESVTVNLPNLGGKGVEQDTFPDGQEGNLEDESAVGETNEADATLLDLQRDILEKLSGLPGIVVLNDTDLAGLLEDPDTVFVGQNITLDPNGNVMISTLQLPSGSMSPVDVSDLPAVLQAAVESALADLLPSGSPTNSPAIVVNILGPVTGYTLNEVEEAKARVRTYVSERTGLRVYTEDSEEVVGPAYYVELQTRGEEVISAEVYYDTVPLRDLEDGRKIKAKIINGLVKEAWRSSAEEAIESKPSEGESSTEALGRDSLETVAAETTTQTENSEVNKEIKDEDKLVIVNVQLADSDISEAEKIILKDAIETRLHAETKFDIDVLVDVDNFEVPSEVTHFYYLPVTVDKNRNVVRKEPINQLPVGGLDKATLDSLILTAVENGLEEIENEVEDIRVSSPTRLPGSPLRPSVETQTRRPAGGSGGQSANRIIEILANLFIRTLDLSISIKGAMDRSSEQTGGNPGSGGGENVEFKIVSTRKKQSEADEGANAFESGDGTYAFLPELIRITPTDAMYINKTDDGNKAEDDGRKPVIIDIVTDQSVRFKVPDGMILEIDLSDLPAEKAAREEEIRSRVRNLIQAIVGNSEDTLATERDALSDAIIKNITQIVMIQMDEALKNGKNSSLLAENGAGPAKPLSVPEIMESIFNIIAPITRDPLIPDTPASLVPALSTTDPAINEVGTEGKTTVVAPNTPGANAVTIPSEAVTSSGDNPGDMVLSSLRPVSTSSSPDLSPIPSSVTTPASPILSGGRPTVQVPPEQVNNVINNVKKTISEIIKDVLEGADEDTKTEDILASVVSRVPDGIKILTTDVNGADLRSEITESVSTILSEKAAAELRNRGNKQERREQAEGGVAAAPEKTESSIGISGSGGEPEKKSRTDGSVVGAGEGAAGSLAVPGTATPSPSTATPSRSQEAPATDELTVNEEATTDLPDEETKLINLFPNIVTTGAGKATGQQDETEVGKSDEEEEDTGLVINFQPDQAPTARTTTLDPLWTVILTASPLDNDIENSEPDKTNNTSNIIQDGRIFADTNSGVVKAKVVEDTNFLARSIGERASIGVAAIISIVIGVLALFCFSLMVFLAMARRRRQMEQIGAPSSTGYTSNSRYSPETGNSSTITDMKPAYMEELSPNVSSFDLQKSDVVIPMDGHLTIVGSYEDFLEVPTGARPNLLQSLPVSPLASFSDTSVPPTHEMNDPELAFAPRYRPEHRL